LGELKNTFSWSFSAAADFEACRRRRYWSKYAMWGGWLPQAPDEARRAYRLSKMENIYSLQGIAAEAAVMWTLRRLQSGTEVEVEEAYREAARPLLNKAWKESREGNWRQDPKHFCCLREHYYRRWDSAGEKEATRAVAANVRRCVENFIVKVWPRLEGVRPADEVAVGVKDAGGALESFEVDGVTVYAIPDYVYRKDDFMHIHDWKSGRPRVSHELQLSLYGLWANIRHGVEAERIIVYIEYLSEGRVAFGSLKESDLDQVRAHIRMSVSDMAAYLVDGDIRRNEPLPKEEWELAADQRECRRCNFYELCAAELEGG